MGFFDLFRPAPKPCTACRAESPELHRVWSGLRDGKETDRLCMSCWTERLGREIASVTRSPEIADRLNNEAVIPIGSTPAEFAAHIRKEHARIGNAVRKSGARFE